MSTEETTVNPEIVTPEVKEETTVNPEIVTPEVAVAPPVHVDPLAEKPVHVPGNAFDASTSGDKAVFHLNTIPTSRTFSADEHGDDWKAIASEFDKNNQGKIVSIDYL